MSTAETGLLGGRTSTTWAMAATGTINAITSTATTTAPVCQTTDGITRNLWEVMVGWGLRSAHNCHRARHWHYLSAATAGEFKPQTAAKWATAIDRRR